MTDPDRTQTPTRPSDRLRAASAADWDAARDHAFTRALVDGSLSRDQMAAYLAQDHQFIGEFVRLLAASIIHAPSLSDAIPAARFLAVITGPENTYFLRSFATLKVTEADGRDRPARETRAFLDLMEEARLSGSQARILAVLVVAEWLYLDWAAPHAARAADLPFWLGEWITLHSGPDFEAVVAYLREQLDRAWDGLDTAGQQAVADVFARAVAAERAFFDAAWEGYRFDWPADQAAGEKIARDSSQA